MPDRRPLVSRSRLIRLAGVACAVGAVTVSACGAPVDEPTAEGRPTVASGSYLLRVPGGDMNLLRRELSRRGISARHEYSDAVGLRGSLAVDADEGQVRALLAAMPGLLEVHADPLRYPSAGCGDATCDADEAQSAARSTTCSFDCGVPDPPEKQAELANSWHVGLIGAEKVWPASQGLGVDVAILDTGYDSGAGSTHPDRPKSLGFSYNFAAKSDDFRDVGDHGTHVTGIVAAARNDRGAVGVAPEATVHAFQVFTLSGGRLTARSSDLIAAVESAVKNNYKIINMSLGGPSDSALEHQALRSAHVAGLLLVAAAGNTEDAAAGDVLTAPLNFPGAYAETLSVGAITRGEAGASYSATGRTVIVSAPGSDVYSSVPVGIGMRQATALFDLPGVGVRALATQSPTGGSRTFLKDVEVVACGLGSRPEITSCKPRDKVALIRRGPVNGVALTFREKIDNARRDGAIGVILYNHRDGDAAVAGALLDSISLGTAHPVPIYTLAAGDGEYLVAATQKGTVRVSASFRSADYDRFSGTSMAAPVVSGLAALLWAKNPALSNVQLRQLIAESAVDLGAPGRDDQFGWGRVDAVRAFAQGQPRARCGDGRLDRESEICDGARVGSDACDLRGFDDVAGAVLTCNAACTAVDDSKCQCAPGRAAFDVVVNTKTGVVQDGLPGVVVSYAVKLMGAPVRGALARVTIKQGTQAVLTYESDPSDAAGLINDFIPVEKTGLSAGTYEIAPVITKGGARCHPDLTATPFPLTIKS